MIGRGRARRWVALLGWVVAFLLLFMVRPATAGAHAQVVRADPAPGSSLAQSPPRVTVWLSEPIIPEGSRLEVYDVSGQRVDQGTTYYHGSPPTAMSVDLGPLPQGNYRVRSVTFSSVDGHYWVTTFPFAVGAAVTAPGVEEARMGSGLPVPQWLPVLLRYITLAGALAWGGIAFAHGFVVGPWLAAHARRLAPLTIGISYRYWWALLLALISLLVGRGLEIAWPMAATVSLGQVAAGWEAARAFLTSRFSLLSYGVLALAVLAVLTARRTGPLPAVAGAAETVAAHRVPHHSLTTEVWAARAHVALAALAMIGLAATGHAAVVSGPYYSSLAAAWAHYVAAAVWVGGILYFAVVLLPATSKLEVSERARARVALLGGFTPYALLAGATLAATGLLRAEVHLPSLSVTVLRQLVRTAYGQALLAKLSLEALMAGVGALHSFWYRRKVWQLLAGGAEKEEVGKPLRRWQRLVQWEAVLAILVMASVAVLITRPALRYGFGDLASPSLGEAGRGEDIARAFLERADQNMNALKSARVRERPGGSNSAGWTDYVLVAPSTMRIQTSNGDETVIWWNLMFTRRSGQTAWQIGFWSPVYRFTWPNYVWSEVAYRPTILGEEEVNGVRCAIVSFTDSAGSTRHTLWIGDDGLVRREEVISVGYHVVREYFDFNAPLEVTIPEEIPHE